MYHFPRCTEDGTLTSAQVAWRTRDRQASPNLPRVNVGMQETAVRNLNSSSLFQTSAQ